MATILNAYNLTGGDTTSSTFTSTGDCITIEATTTSINGVNSLIKIQSSDDQTIWKDIGQIIMCVGSDLYCNDPIKVTGLYVRCLLITNDSTSGTITVTASNGSAGTGDLLSTNNLSDVASAATSNNNLGNYGGTWTPVFTAQLNPLNTLTPVEAWNYQRVGNLCFFMGAATATFDVADSGDQFVGDTPILRATNFATTYQCVGLIHGANTPDVTTQKIKANIGAKTMTVQIVTTNPGDTVIVFMTGSFQLT